MDLGLGSLGPVFAGSLGIARLKLPLAQFGKQALLLMERPDRPPDGVFDCIALQRLQHQGRERMAGMATVACRTLALDLP